ncbi:MBL fold metallo-hydrolase [Camelimonas lactis]|uniref:L-ascorbate metabolism protein UlaG (Beta-lactamase superfamily) n=1 Tax=Camelimonas lactis TaxID=659006 RepID=A0A4R2H0C9_9HYPH|nr:MBL fold metallo-hydrolase [Camelimonas lactis]TCO15923.1 L-ascorbate metabolism protein UlaG (beta-lactamase superfamily) [Camelimonas lactis]
MPRRYHDGPLTDHFDGRRFSNPGYPPTDKRLGDLWRWWRSGQREKWPRQVAVTKVAPAPDADGVCITMVGHATLLIQAGGCNILTDPVWGARAGPLSLLGPRRVTAPAVCFDDLPRIDAVLVSHNHYDHFDAQTLRRLQERHQPTFVTPVGNERLLQKVAPGARVLTGDWGDAVALPRGVTTRFTPANHWSRRALRDTRMALWSGFMIDAPAGRIWFAGDTGYGDGGVFRDIRAAFGAPDVALIPIGAYEPRWFMAAQHVNPDEAVQVFRDIGARRALGMHWGTFQLTDEGRERPREALEAALRGGGIDADRFVAAEPGDVFRF